MISIAMATYNGEKFLREQLDSILAQTIQDFELIVCDDCSTDSTARILREYERNDSRIKVFVNEKNLGFKKNFEKAIGLCSGDYIALSDQDDIWLPEHLENLLNNIEGNSMSVANANLIDANGNEFSDVNLMQYEKFERIYPSPEIMYGLMFYKNPFFGSNSMYRKEVFDKALPMPDGIAYHDVWFSICSACFGGIAYIDIPVTKHRFTGNNVSGNHKWQLFEKKNFLKRFFQPMKTDRLIYCDEILKRFPNIANDIRKIIEEANVYYESRIRRKKRVKNAFYLIRHYKQIYYTNSYKYIFFRVLGILLRG